MENLNFIDKQNFPKTGFCHDFLRTYRLRVFPGLLLRLMEHNLQDRIDAVFLHQNLIESMLLEHWPTMLGIFFVIRSPKWRNGATES